MRADGQPDRPLVQLPGRGGAPDAPAVLDAGRLGDEPVPPPRECRDKAPARARRISPRTPRQARRGDRPRAGIRIVTCKPLCMYSRGTSRPISREALWTACASSRRFVPGSQAGSTRELARGHATRGTRGSGAATLVQSGARTRTQSKALRAKSWKGPRPAFAAD